MNTYEQWKNFVRSGGISTVEKLDWLLQGCPICGCVEWQLTNDGWCYCDGCAKGYSTISIWTNRSLVHFNKNGYHCFMCKGFGKLKNNEICDECDGEMTNENQSNR